MAPSTVTEEELAALVQITKQAAKAYIRRDMRTYFTLMRPGDDYMLMSPFGGEPERGFDADAPWGLAERMLAWHRGRTNRSGPSGTGNNGRFP